MEKHPLHIKNPEFQTSPEVERAVKRQERQTGEKIPNDPAERIEAYMDRLENVFLHPDESVRERNLELFRPKIYDAFIIKREHFPESYFELQKRIARERGQAVEEIPENVRERMMDTAIEDQRASLDAWVDYLASNDAVYPAWFKYFVWKNVTKLSQFDKERGEFKKRTETTVARFPDIHSGALAKILDVYQKVKDSNKNLKEPEIKEAFSKKFPALYAERISKSLEAQTENREEVRGEWVKYAQGNKEDAKRLFASLDNKGTGWCTEGIVTAKVQIESGDFYVYYTKDASGNPTQPRLAIRMEDSRIGEVRGILPHQGVEPLMQEVLDKKLQEFGPEAERYAKKSEDMRMITALEKKRDNNEPFTKEDLTLLYEINGPIEGFGYGKDPRVAEFRAERNTDEDMLIIFDCTKEQIAHVPSEINEHTRAYVGQLEPGIFQKLPEHLEHVYTSFPERKIRREHIEIGGKTAEQLLREMKAAGITISNSAKNIMESRNFAVAKKPEGADLVRLTVADLGFKGTVTTDQIYKRAKELGLELCPAEVGPHYRLAHPDQPMNEWILVAMKQISDSGGDPRVFSVERDADGSWLLDGWAGPRDGWGPGLVWLFSRRKSLRFSSPD